MFKFFPLVLAVVLATSGVLAAPFDDADVHYLGKRDAVCASDFRKAVIKEDCLPKTVAFTLVPPSGIAQTPLPTTDATVLATAQCDHTLELQLLDSVAKNSGFCDILTAIITASKLPQAAATPGSTTAEPTDKPTLLQPSADLISGINNLNFLDGTVNNQKKTFIGRSLKGSTQKTTPLDLAVKAYLKTVGPGVSSIATALDAEIANKIGIANTLITRLTPLAGKGRTDPVRKALAGLTEAVGAHKAAITVTAAWNKVLTDANA